MIGENTRVNWLLRSSGCERFEARFTRRQADEAEPQNAVQRLLRTVAS